MEQSPYKSNIDLSKSNKADVEVATSLYKVSSPKPFMKLTVAAGLHHSVCDTFNRLGDSVGRTEFNIVKLNKDLKEE